MSSKAEILNLGVAPELKELVRLAAGHDHRSSANLIEALVRRQCERLDIATGQELAKQPTSQ